MECPDPDRLAWCVIDDVAVFLDIVGDRYFRLAASQNRQFLDERGPRPGSAPVQPSRFPLPGSWRPPDRQCSALADAEFRLSDVARALWMQRRVERKLSTASLLSVLDGLQRSTGAHPVPAAALLDPHLREVRAFERAKLLRTAADRCLPRSIALALCLARRDCRAHVVLGVKLAPFAAHCWVQSGNEVLNDEFEEVLRYTPILVV